MQPALQNALLKKGWVVEQAIKQSKRITESRIDRGNWPAVYAVALSTFTVVTTEMLPVGLMTPIAQAYDISVGFAGLTISVPAILAALFAPVVVLTAGRIDRRILLSGLMILLMCANAISALAPSFEWLLAARVIVGFCMGGIWSVAGGLAGRLVPPQSVAPATALIFGGVAIASVLGVPLGAFAGELAGWRIAFAGMALFSLVVLITQLIVLPALPVDASVRWPQFTAQFGRRPVQLGLALTLLLVAGHFMAYTFVHPLLQNLSGFGSEWIGLLLFGYGIAGISGNFLAGMLAGRKTTQTLLAIAAGLTVTIAGFAIIGGSQISGAIMLVLWGLAYGGVSVSLQTWMMKSAPDAIEIVTSFFVAVFNIGIALGSFAGGRFVDAFGLHTTLLIASALPAIAFLLTLFMKAAPHGEVKP